MAKAPNVIAPSLLSADFARLGDDANAGHAFLWVGCRSIALRRVGESDGSRGDASTLSDPSATGARIAPDTVTRIADLAAWAP